MKKEEVEKWLIVEAKNKNNLAETYLSLLKDATPEMREHWFNFLGGILGPILQNKDTITSAVREGK
jgi:hypothetical protein